MPESWLPELEPILARRPEMVSVFVAEKQLLETLTGFSMYQGLLAVGKIPQPLSLPDLLARTSTTTTQFRDRALAPIPSSPLEERVRERRPPESKLLSSSPPRLLAAVDGLSSAENLGTIVRNCAAFAVQGLIVGETCCSPYLRRAVRSSMGTVFQLPLVEPVDLTTDLNTLRKEGIRCVAAHPHGQGQTLVQTNLSASCCIVFGSEGAGISPAVLAACDESVAIPMPPTVDSLNVGSAAAVFLYEALRQRGNYEAK